MSDPPVALEPGSVDVTCNDCPAKGKQDKLSAGYVMGTGWYCPTCTQHRALAGAAQRTLELAGRSILDAEAESAPETE